MSLKFNPITGLFEFGGAIFDEAWAINDYTTTRTATLADAYALNRWNRAVRSGYTIPPNSSVAFDIGTVIRVSHVGAGGVAILAGSGVTINKPSTDNMTATKYSPVTLVKVATDTWDLFGSLTADTGSADYETEYEALLSRMTTLGYTWPDDTLKVKQNTLVTALKSAGIWSKLDVLWVFATNNSNNATLNWITPASHQCTLVNAPTFTASAGFKGNGTSSYLDTNFNMSTQGVKYVQNDASRFVWVRTALVTNGMLGGLSGAISLTHEQLTADTSNAKRLNQAGLNQASDMSELFERLAL
jgi:hypothetical protein